jgi:hypothetical protein
MKERTAQSSRYELLIGGQSGRSRQCFATDFLDNFHRHGFDRARQQHEI